MFLSNYFKEVIPLLNSRNTLANRQGNHVLLISYAFILYLFIGLFICLIIYLNKDQNI